LLNKNWLAKAKLITALKDLAKHNTADKDKFDWKNMISKKIYDKKTAANMVSYF
jgi:hypothetical protein